MPIYNGPELQHANLIQFRVTSIDGKTELAAYRFVPQNVRIKAVVQIVHGMCEYLLRYAEYADFLCQNGIEVWGHDHLGHGASAKEEKDLGFFAPRNGSEYLVNDVRLLSMEIKRMYPGLPLFLLGHSMGSFVVRQYLSLWGHDLAGALIVGTGGPESPCGLGKALASVIGFFCGKRHRSKLLKKIAFSGYTSKYPKPCSPAAWISSDENRVAVYEQDPLCYFTFTARGFYDLFDLLQSVSRKEWAGKVAQELPIILLSGDKDPVGNYGKGVKKVYKRLQKAGVANVTLKLYPDARHEVLGETNYEEVWKDTLRWIETQLPSIYN